MTFAEFTYRENCITINCKGNSYIARCMHGLIEGVGELKVCRMFGIQVAKCLQDCLHAHEAACEATGKCC